jgi:hypothetical protein
MSKLELPGKVSEISEEELVMATSLGRQKSHVHACVTIVDIHLATDFPGLLRILVRKFKFPGALTISRFPDPASMCPPSEESVKSVFGVIRRIPLVTLSARTGP